MLVIAERHQRFVCLPNLIRNFLRNLKAEARIKFNTLQIADHDVDDLVFQIAQEIPDEVWQAYETLVALGYDQHLMK